MAGWPWDLFDVPLSSMGWVYRVILEVVNGSELRMVLLQRLKPSLPSDDALTP